MEFFLQIVLILACLFYGARKGGVALGLLGGIGVVILVFAFKLPPGKEWWKGTPINPLPFYRKSVAH